MTIKCFFLVEAPTVRQYLRRYRSSTTAKCPADNSEYSYCNAISDVVAVFEHPLETYLPYFKPQEHFNNDPRWPTACAKCGDAFTAEDQWQVFVKRVHRRTDTNEEMTWGEAPVGAMRYCWWITRDRTEGWFVGPDGKCLTVKLPPDGHEWMPDARAKNCGLPDDDKHKCWVRHGTPPLITVDKQGLTCSAGAGSIDTGKWHGHLLNGELVP